MQTQALQNVASYEGEGVGLSVSVEAKDAKASHRISSAVGYGSDSDSQYRRTESGIGTREITITDEQQQTLLTGQSAQAMKDSVYTSLSSVQVLNQTPLAKTFNRQELEKELQIQVEVGQAFSQNMASARRMLDYRKSEYKAAFKRGELSEEAYEDKVAMLDSVGLGLSVLSAGLSSPSDHAVGIAAASLSPLAAYQIGQYAKAHKMEGSAPHVIAHAVLAGAVAAAGGQDIVSSAVAAGGAELLAPVLSQYLYDKPSSELSAEEKQSLLAILRLAGAGVGAGAGGSNLTQTAQAVDGAVENNYLTPIEYQRRQAILDRWEERGKRGLTLDEAKEFAELMQKDAYMDRLLSQYQQDAKSLTAEERYFLARHLDEIAQGDIKKLERIIATPANNKMEDGRINEVYAKVKQQLGIESSMHMQLARATEPAAMMIGGGGGLRIIKDLGVLRGVLQSASESVGVGVALSFISSDDYTYANLINDIVLGVAIGKKVDVFHSVLKDIPSKVAIRALADMESFYGGKVLTPIISNSLGDRDRVIFKNKTDSLRTEGSRHDTAEP